jgi:hypothetical protein
VVTDESRDSFARRLPSLYFGRTLVFSSRQVEAVARRLADTIAVLRSSKVEPTYLAQACKSNGLMGLYANEFNVRAANRKRLERAGLTFADDAFTRFAGNQRFYCDDFGTFVPSFIVIGGPSGKEMSAAQGAFSLAARRLWIIPPAELEELSLVAHTVPIVGGSTHDLADARGVTQILGQLA